MTVEDREMLRLVDVEAYQREQWHRQQAAQACIRWIQHATRAWHAAERAKRKYKKMAKIMIPKVDEIMKGSGTASARVRGALAYLHRLREE